MESPPTHLCPDHSGRPSQPSDCRRCEQEKKMARMSRRITALEARIDELEGET